MTAPVFEMDDDGIAAAAANLERQADELETAVAAVKEKVPTIESEASSFQGEWEPDGVHAQKVNEIVAVLRDRAFKALSLAATLRVKAQVLLDIAARNAEVQDTSAQNTDDIDTGGIAPS